VPPIRELSRYRSSFLRHDRYRAPALPLLAGGNSGRSSQEGEVPVMRSLLLLLSLLMGATGVEAQEGDHYLLLPSGQATSWIEDINDAADRGFKVIAASRTEGTADVVVMEHSEDRFHYRLLATTKTESLEQELNAAAKAGYRIIPETVGTRLLILEKGPDPIERLSYKVLTVTGTEALQKAMSETVEQGFALIAMLSRRAPIAILERAR
jgi:hypothetical protein